MFLKGSVFLKKILIILFITIFVINIYSNRQENIIIPKDSIRFRIISNSSSEVDIKMKQELKSYIEDKVYDIVSDAKNKEEADKLIVNNLDKISLYVNQYLNSNNYKIDYGINYFPKKVYKGVVYEEGMYKSLVITLGDGLGSNWWCVLFPPLCLLDENENNADVDYQFYIARIIKDFN